MNQMMGSSATAMSKMFNTSVNISTPGVDIIDLANGKGDQLIPMDDVLIKVAFELKVGSLIQSRILQLITVPFVKNVVEVLSKANAAASALTQTQEAPEVQQIVNQVEQNAPYSQVNQYMNQAGFNAPPSFAAPSSPAANRNSNVSAQTPDWPSFNSGSSLNPFEANNLNMLMHIPLKLTVELGRTQKLIKDILELSQGSIVELDKLAGEPVDILVNDQPIAKGEVVVIDENFGVRITEIITQWDRIQKLR